MRATPPPNPLPEAERGSQKQHRRVAEGGFSCSLSAVVPLRA